MQDHVEVEVLETRSEAKTPKIVHFEDGSRPNTTGKASASDEPG